MSSVIDEADAAPAVGVVPTSVGALTAEEWMINPYAPLPSFLEMIWIQEADSSMNQALRMGVEYARDCLGRQTSSSILQTHDAMEGDSRSYVLGVWISRIQQAAQRWKRKGLRLVRTVLQKHPLEIVALLTYLAQRQSLLTTNATLAESMYGGHRVQRTKPDPKRPDVAVTTAALEPLKPAAMTRLALWKALVPYLQRKLEALWIKHLQRYEQSSREHIAQSGSGIQIEKTLLFLYPYLRATIQGADWLCHWRFLMGQSFHFDLASLLLGQIVRRVTMQDQASRNDPQKTVSSSDRSTAENNNSSQGQQAMMIAQRSLSWGLSLAVLVSWLTWMQAEWGRIYQQEQSKLSAARGPIPPPPRLQKPRQASNRKRQGRNECLLCRKIPQQSPTASNSGFVFCWQCIQQYVLRHQTCPVTGKPCREDQLVRLYEPHVVETQG